MDLTDKVLNFIRKECLIKPGGLIVLGVSGGADSVFLAQCLHKLRHKLSLRMHIAHFNHRLRRESGADQRFVQGLALELGVPVSVGSREGRLKAPQLSEDAARRQRFTFFKKVAVKTNAQAVVLAHTADDLAETVLMRLLRGTGLYGLRGILARRQKEDIVYIRPLIGIDRRAIEGYLSRHKMLFRTDKTNARTVYLRNKVRLELLPYLERLNPQVRAVLADLAHTAVDDYAYLETQAMQRLKESVVSSGQTVKISIKKFTALHPSMRRMLVRLVYERLTGDTRLLTFAHVLDVERLAGGTADGALVHWPRSVVVAKTRGFIEFRL